MPNQFPERIGQMQDLRTMARGLKVRDTHLALECSKVYLDAERTEWNEIL